MTSRLRKPKHNEHAGKIEYDDYAETYTSSGKTLKGALKKAVIAIQ